MRSRADVLLWSAFGLLAVLGIALLAHRALVSPAGRMILHDPDAPWIMAEGPISAELQQWGRERAPVTRFVTRFAIEQPPPDVVLRVRAFGEARVVLNEVELAALSGPPAEGDWRHFRAAPVAHVLRAGENTLRVEVSNPRGPPLLALRLEAEGLALASGPHWIALLPSQRAVRTRIAADDRPYPDSFASERPLEALAASWMLVALLAAGSALGFAAARGRLGARAPRLALGAVALGWLVLFASKLRAIDLEVGFDAQQHLDYLAALRDERRVPLATDSWSAYHPPLFYALGAALEAFAGAVGAVRERALALKLVPFLAGFGNVALAGALLRRLFPTDRTACTLAIGFAGVLPVNLYVAAYYSNEGLHAFLAGLALVIAVGLLLREREIDARAAAGLSLVMGLALLTKFTALLVAGPVALAVAGRILVQGRGRTGVVVRRLAALALPMLVVAGWFYARNLWHFGRPLVGNWELPGAGQLWWSAPGFHTPQYYLRFGEVLVRPFYSGFVSFWDALYSTFWGDGFVAGRAGVRARHPHWNYRLMAAGYLLALPATALLVAGFARTVWAAARETVGRRRAAFGLLAGVWSLMAFSVLWATLGLPYHGQARASYLLAALPVWALFFAWPTRALLERLPPIGQGLLVAWLGACFGTLYLGFAA